MKNSNLKKTSYNIIFGILGQVVTLVLGLVLPRLRIVSFGSEVNGLLSSVNQIYTYLALLEAGVGSATIQALYRPTATDNKDDINAILSATNSYYKKTGKIYFACVFLFAIIYPLVVKTDIDWWVIVSVILLNGMGNVLSYFFQGKYKLLLQAEGKQYIITNLATFVTFGSGIAKIVLISLGFGVISLQVIYFVVHVIQVLYFAIYMSKKYKWINLKVKPNLEAISQKNSVMVHQLTQLAFYNSDALILTAFCGLEMVSIFSVYNMVTEMVSTLINNLNNGFSYRLGQLYNSQKERFIQLYTTYERYYTACSFALYGTAYICLRSFIAIYTKGADIDYNLEYLPIMFITVKLLISGRAPSGFVISYAGHFKQTQNRAIIETVINLGVSITAVQFVGIYGVLIGKLAALAYRANDMIIYTNKKLIGRSPLYTYAYWGIYLAIFSLIILFEKFVNFPVNNYFQLILLGGIACVTLFAIYFGVTFVVSYKDSMLFVKMFFRKLKK